MEQIDCVDITKICCDSILTIKYDGYRVYLVTEICTNNKKMGPLISDAVVANITTSSKQLLIQQIKEEIMTGENDRQMLLVNITMFPIILFKLTKESPTQLFNSRMATIERLNEMYCAEPQKNKIIVLVANTITSTCTVEIVDIVS